LSGIAVFRLLPTPAFSAGFLEPSLSFLRLTGAW
jgi:hypothetical protein